MVHSTMLKGVRRGLVKKVQPVSIHGQISLDVYFADPDEPDGQVSLARIGPNSSTAAGACSPAIASDACGPSSG